MNENICANCKHWKGDVALYDTSAEVERQYPSLVDGTAKLVMRRYAQVTKLDDVRAFFAASFFPDLWDNGLYEHHNCSCYSLTPRGDGNFSFIIHDRLQDLQFFRVFDPIMAYQRVEMFVGNRLFKRDCPRIDPVPDKVKAESHGFNKFSFRKDSSKKG